MDSLQYFRALRPAIRVRRKTLNPFTQPLTTKVRPTHVPLEEDDLPCPVVSLSLCPARSH